MISFSAIDFSKYDRRALKIALLSTIPGLGQLFNGRRDKALAFFVVNLANAVFVAALFGCRIPFVNYNAYYFPYFCNAWAPGSVPFSILQCLLVSYIVYAQYDAYKEACILSKVNVSPIPDAGLSKAACGSYVIHLSAFLLIGLLIVLRMCPDHIRPLEENQICLSFELNSPEPEEQKAEGKEGKIGQESSLEDEAKAHLKDPIRDSIKASSTSAEMHASKVETGDRQEAAEETETVASKQIISPYSKQVPQEASSSGASESATKTTKQVDETETNQSSPANITSENLAQSSHAAGPDQHENQIEQVKPHDNHIFEAAKKIAQVPVEVLSGSMSIKIEESNFQPEKSKSSETMGSAPSMLGFMDSKLSSDPSMRLLWSEMSSNISKTIKAKPLTGEGLAMVNFTVDQRGHIASLNTSSASADLAESLVQTLQNMPLTEPPAQQFSKLYFQVKASNLKTGTVVALEINSEPATTSTESLNDFKYQVSLQTYLKGIKKAIYSSWRPPVQEGVKPVMIGFKVSTDGFVSDQHIVESSGDKNMDRAALNASLSVSQWSQPPAGTSDELDVCMVLKKCTNCDAELKESEAGVHKPATNKRAAPYVDLTY